jgi:hypothetical protein
VLLKNKFFFFSVKHRSPQKKSPQKKSPSRRRKRKNEDDSDDNFGSKKLVVTAQRWPFKSDSALFKPNQALLDAEEVLLLEEVDKWVEFGETQPSCALWKVMRELPGKKTTMLSFIVFSANRLADNYARWVYGNAEEFDLMRHPRSILTRAFLMGVPAQLSHNMFAALSQSLLKFRDPLDPQSDFVEALWQLCKTGVAPGDNLLRELMAMPGMPPLAVEYCREALIAMESPNLFGGSFFQARNGGDYRFHMRNNVTTLPFEELVVEV